MIKLEMLDVYILILFPNEHWKPTTSKIKPRQAKSIGWRLSP